MALCPVMSRRGEQVECLQTKCELWLEVEGREGIGRCAIKAIPQHVGALQNMIRMNLEGIARTIGNTFTRG